MLKPNEYQNACYILSFLTLTNRKYALLGTGKIAGQLVDIIRTFGFAPPAFAFDSNAFPVAPFRGIPVCNPWKGSDIPVSIQEIVLATNVFQNDMRAQLKQIGILTDPLDLSREPWGTDATRALHPQFRPPARSETGKVRADLSHYCVGNGIDIGYGGDPILPSAIAMDQPRPYAKCSNSPQHLTGDAQHLTWFRDKTLDYVYSSHVLEDFPDTAEVLDEWIRVLRVGGRLVLFLPDQQAYLAHFTSRGMSTNKHHVHPDFSLTKVKTILSGREDVRIIHEKSPSHIYSFEIVAERTQ